MRDSAMVEVLKDHGFYGMDLSLISKLKKPDYYGIQLTMDARAALGYQYKHLKSLPQVERILAYVGKVGSVSSWEMMNILGILSPTKRISEIRRMPGYTVTQKWESDGKSKWLRYWIERKDDEEDQVLGDIH